MADIPVAIAIGLSCGFSRIKLVAILRMMKDNPQLMATAQKLMENMTPAQMLEQSRAAQAKMSR